MVNRFRLPFPSLQGPSPPYLPENDCPPISGYAKYSDTQMAMINLGKTQQVFTRWPTATFPLNNTIYKELDTVQLDFQGEIVWQVVVNAIEIVEIAADPVPYTRGSQIISANNNNPPRYSIFQAKCSWTDGSAYEHIKYVDIAGGVDFLVVGRHVSVGLLAPNPAYFITNGDQNPATNTAIPELDGVVINAIISARIAPMVAPKDALDILKFTKRVDCVTAFPQFVEIPPGSNKVQIFNCTVGVGPTEMYFWVGNNAAAPVYNLGIIDFTGDRTDIVYIPAGATHISTGANRGFFSVVFTIDP